MLRRQQGVLTRALVLGSLAPRQNPPEKPRRTGRGRGRLPLRSPTRSRGKPTPTAPPLPPSRADGTDGPERGHGRLTVRATRRQQQAGRLCRSCLPLSVSSGRKRTRRPSFRADGPPGPGRPRPSRRPRHEVERCAFGFPVRPTVRVHPRASKRKGMGLSPHVALSLLASGKAAASHGASPTRLGVTRRHTHSQSRASRASGGRQP